MADIAEELAVIRTGIYGKDIREALGDAIEKVNLEGGGGGGGSSIVELGGDPGHVASLSDWVGLSDVEKDAPILYLLNYFNIFFYKRKVYGGPIKVPNRASYQTTYGYLFTHGGAVNTNAVMWHIQDEDVLVVGSSTIGVTSDYKKTYTMTESEYAAAQEAGTLDSTAIYYTFPDPEPPTPEETTEGE